MAFHLNEMRSWLISIVSTALIMALSLYPVPDLAAGPVGALTVALLAAYLVLSGFFVLKLIAWASTFNSSLAKTTGIVVTALSLFSLALLFLGRYFYLSSPGAGLFDQQLEVDYVLRESVHFQIAVYALTGFFLIKGRGRADRVCSVIITVIVIALALG